MSLFRRKPPQRPMISWPVDRPLGDIQNVPSPSFYPTVYSPIAASPSSDFSFAHRWPLKDEVFDQNLGFPSPLHTDENVSIILDVQPPPPPPKDDYLLKELEAEPTLPNVGYNEAIDPPTALSELEQPSQEQTLEVQTSQDSKDEEQTIVPSSPSLPPPSYKYESTPQKPSIASSSPPPMYKDDDQLYQLLSSSPPMYKDDEAVYEDVYDNISPLRSSRKYDNDAIRIPSPLRPRRKFSQEIHTELTPLSPLHSNPLKEENEEEDTLEDLPLIRASLYDEDAVLDEDLPRLSHSVYASSTSSPLSWHSNRTSDMTMSTIATSLAPRASDDLFSSFSPRSRSNKSCTDSYCDFDYEDYFEKIQHEIDISDDRPTDSQVGEAGKIPIFDSDGKGRPFSSIYSGDTAIGDQQMVIFVRHFYCGACQAYLKALYKAIPLQTYFSLPKATSITVIGLGSPELINSYRKRTGCPWPIYADPTKRLYKALGMNWKLRMGKNPNYMKGISTHAWIMSQVDEMNNIDRKLKYRGGHMLWVGGEFLFKDEEVVWCHRMKTFRGHAEIPVIKKILEVEE